MRIKICLLQSTSRYSWRPLLAMGVLACGVLSAAPAIADARAEATDLRSLRLSGDFTLRYQVVQTDVRNAEMRRWMASYLRGVDPKAADDTEKIAPPQRYTITLSSHNGRLLYQKQSKESSDSVLYDGTDTFFISDVMTAGGKAAKISSLFHGVHLNGLLGFPLPALSIPYVSLTAPSEPLGAIPTTREVAGQSPVFHRAPAASLTLEPSTTTFARVGDTIAVQSCVLQDGALGTDQRWDYQRYQLLGDRYIAKEMTFTDYQGYLDAHGKSVRAPEVTLKYSLLESQSHSLPAASYSLSETLSNGDGVRDYRSEVPVAFSFTPSQSLTQQIKRASWDQQRRASSIKKGSLGGNGGSGVFLLGSLGCLTAAWIWRRQHSGSVNKEATAD